MHLKRPHTPRTPQSNDDDSSDSRSEMHPSKRRRSSSPCNIAGSNAELPPLRIYIVSAKLDVAAFQNMVSIVEDHFSRGIQCGASSTTRSAELTTNLHEADVIVTAVRTRPRLERHVDWSLATSKAIVTPEWLWDSAKSGSLLPCENYAAVYELREETSRQCPENSSTEILTSALLDPGLHKVVEPPLFADPEEAINPQDAATLDYASRYSCKRASPLVCPNQDLVQELDIIRRCRNLEGEERSMLSYARAIANSTHCIVAFPQPITQKNVRGEVEKLPFLGEKILSMIEEYITTGKIAEAREHRTILSSSRKLYSLGLRTLEELEKYYEVIPGVIEGENPTHSTYDGHQDEDAVAEISVKVALALRHDLSQTYRRGKLQGNDVDIVISHSDWALGSQKIKGLCKRLVERLQEQSRLSSFSADNVETCLHSPLCPELVFHVMRAGLKFDSSGISRRRDSFLYFPKSEREVFEVLGIAYVHPTMRNADA
ncbi:hypothetical protein ID866_3598 [Astraeus odoratus]|nr:hypothetical protein ID866_3598 [Astraeus odoratus]